MSGSFEDKDILLTGGTGSFGQKLTDELLEHHSPRKIIIFSRDEWKQSQMRKKFPKEEYSSIRYFIGNVRDKDRLYRAFDGVDTVIHAAALKQVPTAEYNPSEAIKTNVLGANNIIEAAIDRDVNQVIALSTDKAANPINLYGATKLCSDKLFTAGNHYSGKNHPTRFSVVRYGNVIGSRGSVIPFFLKKRDDGVLPITDFEMTRFWITLEEAVELVINALQTMHGGEIYVPKIPSMKITDLAKAIAPQAEMKEVGIRPGEKLHEVMIPKNEARNTLEFKDYYVIQPTHAWWNREDFEDDNTALTVDDDFEYTSNQNDEWLSVKEMRRLLDEDPKLNFSLDR